MIRRLPNPSPRCWKAIGYEVTHAADGLSGLLAFNQNPDQWAAVLVDLQLPHVSGNALLKEMHRIRPTLPLIVLTGAEPGTNLDVYEQGAVILWHKPVSSSESPRESQGAHPYPDLNRGIRESVVPEGLLRIARQFIAGYRYRTARPSGTAIAPPHGRFQASRLRTRRR